MASETTTRETPAEILSHEFADYFVDMMKNRIIVSFFKYGRVRDNYPANHSALKTLKERLSLYEKTGNTEWLVDVANMAMIEHMCPSHPSAHYRATDSNESPGLAGHES